MARNPRLHSQSQLSSPTPSLAADRRESSPRPRGGSRGSPPGPISPSPVSELAAIFGPKGPLARDIPGYRFRPQQLAMAEAVAETLANGGILVSEAGTGTGKTFAYLVPALLSGRKLLLSTGTKNLQEQLFHRDLPQVRKALGSGARIALLKGRGNYLCRHRLDIAQIDSRRDAAISARQLAQIRTWAGRTKTGDIAECTGFPEDAPVWSLVTSTTDNCLGPECPSYQGCHLLEARRRAQESDLVVINHHLLCADFAIKDEGFGELLPATDAILVDEAHQLPEVASDFFGTSVSARQFLDLLRDTEKEYQREAGDWPELPRQLVKVAGLVQDLRLAFGAETKRAPWREITRDTRIEAGLNHLERELGRLGTLLDEAAGRGKGLEACRQRCQTLDQRLAQVRREEDEDQIRWFEVYRQGFRLSSTPLEVADLFRARMASQAKAWVFTSATLAVGESFQHFTRQIGIGEARTNRWESPFDYPRQALCYLPEDMPDPSDPRYIARLCELAELVLEASRGRAFLLFTSHRALQQVAASLEGRLPFPLLVQGSLPRNELIERFRRLGNAVLLGTSSFWEGVDVRGSALSCVLIDKLPFAAPDDPVLQARLDALRERGGNPFLDYQIPQAAIALKQGAGRLIRDEQDCGVLVLCDPRLLTKGYGRLFLDSLPPMRQTRNFAEVKRFFAAEKAASSAAKGKAED